MAFELPPLPYAYDALEPTISEETMKYHHDKHHAAYVNNLNNALKDQPALDGKSAVELIKDLNAVPESIRMAVRNNAGGHVNHSMFWRIMAPVNAGGGGGALARAARASASVLKLRPRNTPPTKSHPNMCPVLDADKLHLPLGEWAAHGSPILEFGVGCHTLHFASQSSWSTSGSVTSCHLVLGSLAIAIASRTSAGVGWAASISETISLTRASVMYG